MWVGCYACRWCQVWLTPWLMPSPDSLPQIWRRSLYMSMLNNIIVSWRDARRGPSWRQKARFLNKDRWKWPSKTTTTTHTHTYTSAQRIRNSLIVLISYDSTSYSWLSLLAGGLTKWRAEICHWFCWCDFWLAVLLITLFIIILLLFF